MPMYEVLTVRQIVAKCKEYDPGTDINRDMLYTLFREGKIPYDMHGNRLVADFYAVMKCITNRLMLYELRTFPKIRTVRHAARDLREQKLATGINEKHIRAFLRTDSLRSIEIGNRHYIALQSFDKPYNHCLFGSLETGKPKDTFWHHQTADYQLARIRSQNVKPAVVRRVKRK